MTPQRRWQARLPCQRTLAGRWQAATAAYAVCIFVASVIPVAPRFAPGRLDKAVHLCEYLLLAWLLVQALRAGAHRAASWVAWGWATGYGMMLELVQALVPWRSAEVSDALANALGAALGVGLARIIPRKTR